MKHQEVVARWMLHNDRAFNTSEPGTGKTCTVIGATERLRKARKQGKLIGNIRHAYIIVPKSLVNEIKHQLHCVCTQPEDVKAGDIDDFYTVTTYQTFANEVIKNMFQDNWTTAMVTSYLREEFSNCFFYCDESQIVANVHDYDNASFSTQEPYLSQSLAQIYTDSARVVVDKKQQAKETRAAAEYRIMYYVLWMIFHLARHTKVMLGTATPNINQMYDIVLQFNLLSSEDRQLSRAHIEGRSWRDIAPYFKGLFFYIRMPDNGVSFVQPGFPLPNRYQKVIDGNVVVLPSQSRVVPTMMSAYQLDGYRSQTDRNNNSLAPASLFRFPVNMPPGVSASSVAAGELCYSSGAGMQTIGLRATLQYQDYLSSLDNVRNSGANYATMLQLCWGYSTWSEELRRNMGSPDPYHQQLHRKVFIFCDLKKGAGVFNMGLALQHCQAPIDLGGGYRSMFRYEGDKANFIGDIKVAKGCSATGERRSINTQSLQPAPRYAIISGSDTQGDKKKAMILELFNHPDNWDGKYLRVLLGTEVIMTGFNLKEASAVIKMGSPWNYANALQVRTRIFRTDGHLLTMERQRQMGETRYPLFDITLAAVTPEEYQLITSGTQVDGAVEYESYDLKTVLYAEKKDIDNSEVHRAYKSAAIDCMLHRARNVRDSDQPWTRDTDYHPDAYTCIEPPQDIISQNDSLYDLEYAHVEVQQCVTDIIALLRRPQPQARTTLDLTTPADYPGAVPVKGIYSDLADRYRYSIIDKALQQLVTQKLTFTDGYQRFCHAIVEGGMIVLVGNHYDPRVLFKPCHKGLSLSVYHERILSVIHRPIEPPVSSDNIIDQFESAAVKYYYQGDRSDAVVDIIKKCGAYHCVIPTRRLSGVAPLSQGVVPLLNIITKCYNGFVNNIQNVYDVNSINTSKGTGNRRSKTEPIDNIDKYTKGPELMIYKARMIHYCINSMTSPPLEAQWLRAFIEVISNLAGPDYWPDYWHVIFDWNHQKSWEYIDLALRNIDSAQPQYSTFSSALRAMIQQLPQAVRWFNTDVLVEGTVYPTVDFLYWFYYELLPGMPHNHGDLPSKVRLYAYEWVDGKVSPADLTVFHILDCLSAEHDYARIIAVERSGASAKVYKTHRVRYFDGASWIMPVNDYVDSNDVPLTTNTFKFKLMPLLFSDLQYLQVSRMQRVMELRCRSLFYQLNIGYNGVSVPGVYAVLLSGLFGTEDLLFTADNTGVETKRQLKGRSYRTVIESVVYTSILAIIAKYSASTGISFGKDYLSGKQLFQAAVTALSHYGLLLYM